MLQKPNLPDAVLAASLSQAYGIQVQTLAFLPLGADAGTAVYRADTANGRVCFAKLRRGPLDENTVTVPRFLAGQGLAQIIAPLATLTGELWTRVDVFTLTLYPFVEGEDGYTRRLTEQQWTEFGAAVKRLHSAPLPDALSRALPRETYSPRWRALVRAYQTQLRNLAAPDPVAAGLAAFLQSQAAVVDELLEAAEQLGYALSSQPPAVTLCHADLHAGNLLITPGGALYLVDWDTALLAPKERDLMFIGSGLGPGWNDPQTAVWFYQGYGAAEINLAALAYYRCERLVQDIAAYCEEILSPDMAAQDRAQGLHYLKSSFHPNGVAAMALQSYRSVKSAGGPA